MCGIAGILDLRGRPVERPPLERMCADLAHRGPDDEGYYLNCRAGLGQRRLSIIDLLGGQQPMGNEDGSVWVSFNGEIYNFHELRRDLEARGHRFASQSDTEVIVHAYEQYGAACVERFRGMFAFAVWDQNRQTLLLARDRVGKKPLFYAEAEGQFLFASELHALVSHPAIRRELDYTAIDDYLTYGYIPAPKTALQGVYKLLPAHYLELRLPPDGSPPAGPRIERYWKLEYGPKFCGDEQQAVEALLEELTEAVRLRLVADVPLGALLSGGVDSSVVVALMAGLCDRPVKTFSIGFEEQGYNELPFARLVAQRYGTEHHELIVRPNALELLPTLVRHYGEPFADSSAIPSFEVARLTRQHVKVALNGDGGDESFGGYERYLGSMLAERYQRVPRWLRQGVVQPMAAMIPDSLPARHRLRQAKRLLDASAEPFARRYLRWMSYFTPSQKQTLYTPEFRQQLAPHDAGTWLLGQAHDAQQPEHLDSLLALDVQSYLPNDLLVKMDIATMGNSLEARSPLLDHKVMELCARLPGRYKVRGGTLKYLLKKLGQRLLPAEVLNRRKMGFGLPLGAWMRKELRPLMEDLLLSPQTANRGYFEPPAVRRLVQDHVDGRQESASQLWALVWLEQWHRQYVDN